MSTTSNGSPIGGTLTSGIQDISALLPLLGTEQCEEHVASALTDGFLYAAATPISIFGSLGVARAGFKTLLAVVYVSIPCPWLQFDGPQVSIPWPKFDGTRISIRSLQFNRARICKRWLRFDGAQILANAGFKPQGKNLSLIMFNEDQRNDCAGKRLRSMMEELHIEDSSRVTVSSKIWAWNFEMMLCTAISCIISITPYIHLNLHGHNRLNEFTRWAFPVIRAIGGFFTVTTIQLLIQSRILETRRKQLIINRLDDTKLQDFGIDVDVWTDHPRLEQPCSILLEHKMPSPDDDNVTADPPIPPSATPDHTRTTSSANLSSHNVDVVSRATPPARDNDLEKGLPASNAKETELKSLQTKIVESRENPVFWVISLALLLVGIFASVAGYIGCFSVVQGVQSSSEALIWVSIEAGLSVLRIILWGINPKFDDAPDVELELELDKHSPLPTCTSSVEYIEDEKVLPLVRASEFLDRITSYTGLLNRFSDPTLTVYYTLTRKYNTTSEDKSQHDTQPGEHVLYITIFHHTEGTTRVYTEAPNVAENATGSEIYFYSADQVDQEHGELKTRIGHQIQHEDYPIAGNATLRKALEDYYRSILSQLEYRLTVTSGSPPGPKDVFKNDWTLKFEEPGSKMQTEATKEGERVNDGVNVDDESDRTRDREFLKQGWLERRVRKLIDGRGKWIMYYMEWLYRDLDRVLGVQGIEIKGKERSVVEILIIMEREQMEAMLVDEVYRWEKWRFDEIVKTCASDAGLQEAEKSWRVRLWELREEGRLAMKARMEEAENVFLQRIASAGKDGEDEWRLEYEQSRCNKRIEREWESVLAFNRPSQLGPSEWLESRLHDMDRLERYISTPSEKDNRRYREGFQKMESRLKREIDGVKERLNRGFEACDEFRSNSYLVYLTHSESKWLYCDPTTYGRDVMYRALANNPNVIHIEFNAFVLLDADISQFFTMIRNKPTCTSIRWHGEQIPASVELPPNILSISGSTLSEKQEATLNKNISQLDGDPTTTFEFRGMDTSENTDLFSMGDCSFTVRFMGPTSGQLKLQLVYRSPYYLAVELEPDKSTERILPSDVFVLKEIMIWNRSGRSSKSAGLTFAPDVRNSLTCTFTGKPETWGEDFLLLHDVNLLDENGLPYAPAKNLESRCPRKFLAHLEDEASESDRDEGDTGGLVDSGQGEEHPSGDWQD